MNSCHVIYCLKTGEIDGVISGPEGFADMQASRRRMAALSCHANTLDTTHYVDVSDCPHKILEREPIDASVSVDGLTATVTELPAGLTARIEGYEIATDGDPLTITFDAPGIYTLTADGLARYLPLTLEITIDGDD